ncbi:MAG: DUF1801 domain-containing protein [Lewinellaceae bacterium]|jgi:uncharacterized protein YdhG (YjbR/CyaY superfamily)|nr:DUF1801 domain-containing protein [Lewinellaceae bacterium]
MTYNVSSPAAYIAAVSEDRRAAFEKLRETIVENIPDGFREGMNYGMIGYVVPHELYPPGYHCDPKLPLPFVSIAAQKNFIALYHMGLYAMPELLDWFVSEYPKHAKSKLDMGKSCIRFKKTADIPFELIAQLMQRIGAEEWVEVYESAFRR